MNALTVYRSGELESERGLFFANCYDAAWFFSQSSGKPVCAYEVAFSNPLRLESQYRWLADRTGKTVEQVKADKSKTSSAYWLRDLDAQIMQEAIRAGHDAVIYEKPTSPLAAWEIVVFSPDQCSFIGECGDDGLILRVSNEPSFSPSMF